MHFTNPNSTLKAAALCAFPIIAALLGNPQECCAVPITSGTTIVGIFTPFGESGPSGATLLDSISVPFSSATLDGVAQTEVFIDDSTNPYGLDRLTFVYTVSNDIASAHAIGRITAGGYEGFLTDVSYVDPAAGTAPAFVNRDASGGLIGFSFGDTPLGYGFVAPGTSARQLVVRTNATGYASSILSIINGTTAEVGTFSPIPEPTGVISASLGVLLTARTLRSRRRSTRM